MYAAIDDDLFTSGKMEESERRKIVLILEGCAASHSSLDSFRREIYEEVFLYKWDNLFLVTSPSPTLLSWQPHYC